jgi:Flp pilus assembly protein TadD
MGSRQVSSSFARFRALAVVGVLALGVSGCLKRSPAEVTGAIPDGPASVESHRRQAGDLAKRYESNPADPAAALAYARALRGSDQRAQAVAVLQQAAIRSPNNLDLLAAYGKALSDVGRYKEAADVLGRAHMPEKPDWRILSAQGAVQDHVGDHAQAQRFYEAALRIAPDEPSVLSNLGLSYALSKRLPEAEKTLRLAASRANADPRVRQNLALVLGLQGRFADAEQILARDLSPEEAKANLGAMKTLVSQPNSWKTLQRADSASPGRPPNG